MLRLSETHIPEPTAVTVNPVAHKSTQTQTAALDPPSGGQKVELRVRRGAADSVGSEPLEGDVPQTYDEYDYGPFGPEDEGSAVGADYLAPPTAQPTRPPTLDRFRFRVRVSLPRYRTHAVQYLVRLRAHSVYGAGEMTDAVRVHVPALGALEFALLFWHIASLVVSGVLLVALALIAAGAAVKIHRLRKAHRRLLTTSVNPDYFQTEPMYSPDEWELERALVTLVKDIGQGSFGMVYEGARCSLESGVARSGTFSFLKSV